MIETLSEWIYSSWWAIPLSFLVLSVLGILCILLLSKSDMRLASGYWWGGVVLGSFLGISLYNFFSALVPPGIFGDPLIPKTLSITLAFLGICLVVGLSLWRGDGSTS